MIGKLIGAAAGAAVGSESRKVGGKTGAVIGALAVPMVRRLRIPTLLALAGGGYLVKKMADKGGQDATKPAVETDTTLAG
ncbi:hypothetical protein CP97_03565 [Aurantiacibacter atlanticus]|uniref:Uncharacterized protein n=1 Tax=Aurantiacibacter atlanticus TaxID=1648404 RepID=A0A0H4VER1_9SPHN|nr:hypothetical protein [Aurantiacibacter atlanticus]AKQ41316.1 hypothetical protein CP97_03565 [Aurantiacibacter atlanticus]MDF1834603.1 hypothetical protein [Alteraurantiacibacter sp. bin_em_oilr2.035]